MANGVAIPGLKKEGREIAGRRYVLEPAIAGDVAFVRAWKVDQAGNCVFRYVFATYYDSWRLLIEKIWIIGTLHSILTQ
jgi:acyl CoA:acetate/3-ketoacid CoA transferase alpha subunit